MSARPVPYCLLAWVFIHACSGKSANGPGRDAAADPVATGGAGAVGVGGALDLGGAAAGATTALGGTGAGGRSATGGTTATVMTNTGGGKGGASGSGGVTQGGESGSSTGDTSSDDGGTDGTDADQGDADPKTRYAACRSSADETTCSARGGTWRMDYNNTYGICVCPTGEGGRPCAASADCLGDCTAWMDPMLGTGTWCQKNVTGYTCSAEGGKQGCWCRPETPFAVCYP